MSMQVLDPTVGIGLVQSGLLIGIFYRMGSFRTDIQNVKRRLQRLEKRTS